MMSCPSALKKNPFTGVCACACACELRLGAALRRCVVRAAWLGFRCVFSLVTRVFDVAESLAMTDLVAVVGLFLALGVEEDAGVAAAQDRLEAGQV